MGKIIYNGRSWDALNKKADKDGIILTGDVTGTSRINEEGKTDIRTMRRGCYISRGNLTNDDRPWYKIASVSYPKNNYQNFNINLLVNYTYAHTNITGILKVALRINGGTISPSGSIVWQYNTGINPEAAVLVFYEEDDLFIGEIWYYNQAQFQTAVFDVLSESLTYTRANSNWKLYNYHQTPGFAEPPSEYTKITATLAKIQNSIESTTLGMYRYTSGSSYFITIPYRRAARYFGVASQLGTNGITGRLPVVFISEFPYDYDGGDPKITYVLRSSEEQKITITKENGEYEYRFLHGDTEARYVKWLLIQI